MLNSAVWFHMQYCHCTAVVLPWRAFPFSVEVPPEDFPKDIWKNRLVLASVVREAGEAHLSVHTKAGANVPERGNLCNPKNRAETF